MSEFAFTASLPLCLPLLASLRYVRLCVCPPRKALDIPFYRYKEMAQLYNGGVAMC
jgi:hypothetical protein